MSGREMAVWIAACVCAAAVLLSPVACTINRQTKVVEAIKAGADPIEAKCALDAMSERDALCLLVAGRKR